MNQKKKAALILNEGSAQRIYGPNELAAIREIVDLRDGVITREMIADNPSVLADVQIMFSGWGAPVMDAAFLAAAPKLEAVFYGAGSIRYMVTPEFWARNIPITSSWHANGIPVAEFAEAQIILSLKKFWQTQRSDEPITKFQKHEVRGAYGARIGLVSLGMIGRMMAERLKNHNLEVVAYDPFVDQAKADAAGLNVKMVSLEEVFATSDVVSLHTPNLEETKGMITESLFASMKKDATFINTARGAVVNEDGLIKVFSERRDLMALLDVTFPEPPVAGSPLYTMPNIVLTPHIAGSMGDECYRMGQYTIDACKQFLAGEKLQWQVSQQMAEFMA